MKRELLLITLVLSFVSNCRTVESEGEKKEEEKKTTVQEPITCPDSTVWNEDDKRCVEVAVEKVEEKKESVPKKQPVKKPSPKCLDGIWNGRDCIKCNASTELWDFEAKTCVARAVNPPTELPAAAPICPTLAVETTPPSTQVAADGYFRGYVGVSKLNRNSLSASSYGELEINAAPLLSLGYERRLRDVLWIEGELMYSAPASINNNYEDGGHSFGTSAEIQTTRLFANLLLSPTIKFMHPYVGLGLGVSYNIISNPTFKKDQVTEIKTDGGDTVQAAYQLLAGLDFDISEKIYVGFNFRYVNLGKFQVGKNQINYTTSPPKTESVPNRQSENSMTAFEFLCGVGYGF